MNTERNVKRHAESKELARLAKRLKLEGYSIKQISEAVDRQPSTVYVMLKPRREAVKGSEPCGCAPYCANGRRGRRMAEVRHWRWILHCRLCNECKGGDGWECAAKDPDLTERVKVTNTSIARLLEWEETHAGGRHVHAVTWERKPLPYVKRVKDRA